MVGVIKYDTQFPSTQANSLNLSTNAVRVPQADRLLGKCLEARHRAIARGDQSLCLDLSFSLAATVLQFSSHRFFPRPQGTHDYSFAPQRSPSWIECPPFSPCLDIRVKSPYGGCDRPAQFTPAAVLHDSRPSVG